MLPERYPYYLANVPAAGCEALAVRDKYDGRVVTHVARADRATVEAAIGAAVAAAGPMRRLAAYERQAVLEHCVRRFREEAEELAQILCIEAGKPIRDARGEVGRSIDTFRIAAEESVRQCGELLPLDIGPRGKGYTSLWRRFPIGPCAFISPFNFPLNLVAHKVAPAIAVGCPFVLKPASATPIGALRIGAILAETDLPRGAFSILPCSRADAEPLTSDERLKLLSFTGSPEVGWDLKARAGKKQVVLELGGNAAVVVDETLDEADLADAVERIVFGAFYQSGQSCIGVQRILVQRSIYAELRARLVTATRALVKGDPRDERTFIGPMIDEAEARRLEGWIHAALAAGAKLLCGGTREGALLDATLLEDVPTHLEVCAKEAFGPLAVLAPFDHFDEALAAVNDSVYGLQAGVFTRDLYRAQRAFEELEVGGVVIGDVPSFRMDNMPYGGVKDSGIGREGVRFAMEHLGEPRLLVLRTRG